MKPLSPNNIEGNKSEHFNILIVLIKTYLSYYVCTDVNILFYIKKYYVMKNVFGDCGLGIIFIIFYRRLSIIKFIVIIYNIMAIFMYRILYYRVSKLSQRQ